MDSFANPGWYVLLFSVLCILGPLWALLPRKKLSKDFFSEEELLAYFLPGEKLSLSDLSAKIAQKTGIATDFLKSVLQKQLPLLLDQEVLLFETKTWKIEDSSRGDEDLGVIQEIFYFLPPDLDDLI